MQPKFKKADFVKVAGEATGYGDLIGCVVDISTDAIYSEPYYNLYMISDKIKNAFVAERFLKAPMKSIDEVFKMRDKYLQNKAKYEKAILLASQNKEPERERNFRHCLDIIEGQLSVFKWLLNE